MGILTALSSHLVNTSTLHSVNCSQLDVISLSSIFFLKNVRRKKKTDLII